MNTEYKYTYKILLTIIFLLPIFFVPGFGLEAGKSALLVFGTSVAVLAYLAETLQRGKANLPWHLILPVSLLLPLVYLVSALSANPSVLSLFGYNFEAGTFGFILLGSALFLLSALVFRGSREVLSAVSVLVASLSLVLLFSIIKLLSGGSLLEFGIFPGNMTSPIGRWTDIAMVFGLLSILSALGLGFVNRYTAAQRVSSDGSGMRGTPSPYEGEGAGGEVGRAAPTSTGLRVFLYAIFGLSVLVFAIAGFSTAFWTVLVFSIVLITHFETVEKSRADGGPTLQARVIALPAALGLICVLFLINPVVSPTHGPLGNWLSGTFKVENADVRPSLSTTFGISKAVLGERALLGSGPNTFGRDWLVHKPAIINSTPYWGIAFPSGSGFLPTQIAQIGALGTAAWLVFLVLLLVLARSALAKLPESKTDRFILLSTLAGSLFLWVSSFVYVPSAAVISLAFVLSGLFVAASASLGIVRAKEVMFARSPVANFASILVVAVVAVGTVALGFLGYQKTASAYYFNKAVRLSNTPGTNIEEVEREVFNALQFSPVDSHYVALSRINFSKAQAAANNTEGTQEENTAIFQDAISRSIASAQAAVESNPSGFGNWIALGQIYASLVPEPLAVEGAYESARTAYEEARRLNPANPEIPLLLAQLEMGNKDAESARARIGESIALKQDYADAYFLLARLEVSEDNIEEAIRSAETGAFLVPGNPGIHFEIGLLKYSNESYPGAVESLRRALALSPDYANAKYYLGLSLVRLDELEEAQAIFEDLAASNPDSQEVLAVLESLREGESPF